MATVEYGKKPTWESEESVSEDYAYQKGEWGRMLNAKIETEWVIDPTFLPSGSKVIADFRAKLQAKGATVVYMKVTTELVLHGGVITHYSKIYTFEEVIFKGSPLTGVEIIAILLIVVVIASFFLLRPLWLKLGGVTWQEALIYDLGTIGILIVLAIIAFIVMGFLGRGKK